MDSNPGVCMYCLAPEFFPHSIFCMRHRFASIPGTAFYVNVAILAQRSFQGLPLLCFLFIQSEMASSLLIFLEILPRDDLRGQNSDLPTQELRLDGLSRLHSRHISISEPGNTILTDPSCRKLWRQWQKRRKLCSSWHTPKLS